MFAFLRRLFRRWAAGPSNGDKSLQTIAGQRSAEEGWRQSEEHFVQLVAGVRDYAVFLLDREGNVVTWNAGAERIKGYKAREIIGQHFSRFYPPEAVARGWPAEELRRAAAEGRFEDEGWRVRKDGSRFWANVVITALRDEGSGVRGFLKITRDLTERKQAEENARRLLQEETARRAAEQYAQVIEGQREQLRVTLTSIGDAVITTDAEGRVTLLNPVAETLTGWPNEDAAGQPLQTVFRIVNEKTRQAVENPVAKVLSTGRIVGLANHTVLIAKDDTERAIDDSAAPIRDSKGNLNGVVLVFRDVTEQRRAERSARFLASIVESSDDAIIGKDLNGIITSWNQGAERLFGYSSAEAVGRPVAMLALPDRADELPAILDRIRRGERVQHFDTVRRAKDGRLVPVSLTVSPIRDEDGNIIGASKIARDISERKQAEAALREEKSRLHATLTSIGDAVIVTDAEGRVTLMNPVAQALTQWDEEATGRPLGEVFHILNEQTRRPAENPASRVLREGTVAGLANHTVLIAKDGTERPIDDSAAPITNEQGETVGVVLVFRDVADRRQAEAALRASEAQFRQLADAMPQIVWAARSDGSIDYYNERWYEYTGFPRGEYGQQSWEPILHPDDVQRCVDTYFGCIKAEKPYQIEYRFKDRKTGGYRWFLGRAMPVRDEQGRIVRWFGTCTDIDDTKKTGERLRLLWEGASVLLTTTGPDAMLRELFARIGPHFGLDAYFNYMVNETGDALRLASYAGIPEETARSITRLEFGQAICGTAALHRQPIVATHIQQSDDPKARLVKSFGIRAFACNPLLSGNKLLGTLAFASRSKDRFDAEELEFLQTICHYVTAAYERVRLIQQLRDTDRRKDEFLATLAHELRNPLAPIRNAVELLRRSDGDTALIEQSRNIMERQLEQMVRLIDDLLDVSRISRGKLRLRKERVELAEVVRSAMEAVRPFLEAQAHQLTVTLPPDAIYLDADPTRLAQVISNLLNNAAKYTEKGGHIWLTAERQGGEAVVSVRDTGIGIAAEHLPRLFEMFSQVAPALERSQGGLGIGLALVRRLVDLHGGKVEARSGGIGRGSEFVVRLPIVDVPIPREPAETAEGRTLSSARKRRVLVVDDNRDAADTLAMMLAIMGHETRTSYDGLEAVQAAADFRPGVVLLDIGLPKMNGYEAARHLRQQPWGKGMVLIALTGWGQEEDKRRALEAGFDHHLTKPVEAGVLERLLAIIQPVAQH
jgi:PAS domain S-box-containing protein